MTVPPEAITAAAKDVCAHYWAYHCFAGLSVRLCKQCQEPDWDDVRAELAKARAEGAAAERDRIRQLAEDHQATVIADRQPDGVWIHRRQADRVPFTDLLREPS